MDSLLSHPENEFKLFQHFYAFTSDTETILFQPSGFLLQKV